MHIHVHVYSHVNASTCTHQDIYTCIHTYINTYLYRHIHTTRHIICIHVYIHTYVYTSTRISQYTPMHKLLQTPILCCAISNVFQKHQRFIRNALCISPAYPYKGSLYLQITQSVRKRALYCQYCALRDAKYVARACSSPINHTHLILSSLVPPPRRRRDGGRREGDWGVA